jgi:hypothetical protein
VDFSIVEDPKAKFPTARERLHAHNTDAACAGCHKITDPIGLALERFDGSGAYREVEHGAPIDASGSLDGHPYPDAVGLGQALHDNPATVSCLVERLYSYSVARQMTPKDKPLLTYLNGRFGASGYQVPELMRTIALSGAFSTVTAPVDAPPASKQVLLLDAPAAKNARNED